MTDLSTALFNAAELMAAVSSIVVASWVGGAVVQNQKDQRHHNRLSVKPLVHLWTHHEDRSLTVRLENNGVGPAIIRELSIFKKGDESNKFIFDDLSHFLLSFREDIFDIVTLDQIRLAQTYSLPAGKSIDLIHIQMKDPYSSHLIKALFSSLEDNVLMEVIYESIYGEEVRAINP